MPFAATRAVLDAALAAGTFPAAALEVGRSAGPLYQHAAGTLSLAPGAPPATLDTLFDLASLTKVIATASLVMTHTEAGRVSLETPLTRLLPEWHHPSHARVELRHLLDHSSGLPGHARLWEHGTGRARYEHAIRQLPLDTPPGVASVYSDLGFILLGFIIEDLGHAPLDAQFRAWAATWGSRDLMFNPPVSSRTRTAPTETDPWRGRLLVGEVHDENAAALDGVAGHAGLFGTVTSVGQFARLVLRTLSVATPLGRPSLMQTFASKTGVAGSSRALAWDTMLPSSSCGTHLSASAIGHTGFTGTSLWIDPILDLYVALLTNRVHPSRGNDTFAAVRPRVHDAVIDDLRATGHS